MLRYKRWTFEAWYQSECTIIPSLAPWLVLYYLKSYFENIPLGNTWKWKLSSDFISSYNLTTTIHHTSMDILNLELMPCKHTHEMHIQMHHTSLWACSPYLCASKFHLIPFLLSYLSSYVKFSPYHLYLYFSSPLCCLFTYLCALSLPLLSLMSLSYLYLCFSPPLSSMTTKTKNIDSTTCRVEIINANQWGEDHFLKFGPI